MDRRDRDYSREKDRYKGEELERRRTGLKDIERRRGREPIEERDIRETDEERRRSFEEERAVKGTRYERRGTERETGRWRGEPGVTTEGAAIKVVDQPRHKVALRVGDDINPLVELIRNLWNGNLPTNQILNEALEQTKNAFMMYMRDSGFASGSREKKLIEDFTAVLNVLQKLWNETNNDGKFQEFLQALKDAATEAVPAAATGATEKIKKHGVPLAEDFRRFFYEFRGAVYNIVTHPEFRNFLVDLLDFFQVLFSRATDSAQGNLQPPQQFAATLPTPTMTTASPVATRGEWVKVPIGTYPVYGQTYPEGPILQQATPITTTTMPMTGMTTTTVPGAAVTTTTTTAIPMATAIPMPTVSSIETEQRGSTFPQPMMQQPPIGGGSFGQTSSYGGFSKSTTSSETRGIGQVIREDIVSGNTSLQGTRETATQMLRNVATDFKEGRLWADTEEKRRLSERFRNLLIRATDNPEFKNAMRELMRLWDHFMKLTNDLTKELSGTTRSPALRKAVNLLKDIVAAFTHRPVDALLDTLTDLRRELQRDSEATYLLREMRTFFEKTLERPELLKDDSHFNKIENFVTRGRELVYKPAYNRKIRTIIDELNAQFNGLTKNKIMMRFFDDWRNLFTDLFMAGGAGGWSLRALSEAFNLFRRSFVPVAQQCGLHSNSKD